HQRRVVERDAVHDRAGFEQAHAVRLEGGYLAERMPLAACRAVALGRVDQHGLVREPRLLERPAHAQVAHQAAREGRHGLEAGDDDAFHIDVLLDYSADASPATTAARRPSSVRQPPLMLAWAWALRGSTKPEWTSMRRVPPASGVSVQVTVVSSSEP